MWLLRLLTAAGLVVDAYVHAELAGAYDGVQAGVSEGTLFRVEAAVAALAALLVLVAWRSRWVWAFAFVVAASALGTLLLYRYVDVGTLGPLPNMHEPVWYPKKTVSAVAEGVAALAAAVGFATVGRYRLASSNAGPSGR
ncbi:hypothetical protein GCM10010211_78630 [Streptomyces albospinus]|uniref:DUF1772 domain-containing protein n=1 Tax=Streptomyces albospinus TaxID=285515 RepID=A0ABQ2VPE1_9ACTN|nr:hypothetical protein [Streptomyces albospinus]GGU99559.1 hypothetical protein GCM10010211_78630 [Streptomyces albospinus]